MPVQVLTMGRIWASPLLFTWISKNTLLGGEVLSHRERVMGPCSVQLVHEGVS